MRTLRYLRRRGISLITVVVHQVNRLQCRLRDHHWDPGHGVCVRCGVKAW